jgi:hypothetical protein
MQQPASPLHHDSRCHVLKEILLISRAHDIASSLDLMGNHHHAAPSITTASWFSKSCLEGESSQVASSWYRIVSRSHEQPASCSTEHHHSIMILEVMPWRGVVSSRELMISHRLSISWATSIIQHPPSPLHHDSRSHVLKGIRLKSWSSGVPAQNGADVNTMHESHYLWKYYFRTVQTWMLLRRTKDSLHSKWKWVSVWVRVPSASRSGDFDCGWCQCWVWLWVMNEFRKVIIYR